MATITVSSNPSTTGDYNTKYTFVAETTKIRYGCYDPRKFLSYCNLIKTS